MQKASKWNEKAWICKDLVQKMQKYEVAISNTGRGLDRLTARFRGYQSLLRIGFASMDVQQGVYVEILCWIGLQDWFRFQAFLKNFQVWFFRLCSLLVLIFVPLHCMSNMEWIRSSFGLWILMHWWFRIWYDPPWTSFQIWPKTNILCMI